jgi:uncharacterized protein YbjQ (UPF0145 family)
VHEPHHRKIIYHPPSSDAIEQLVRQVCKQLGDVEGQQCYSTEVVNDFMAFVKTIIRTKVKQLNKQYEQE